MEIISQNTNFDFIGRRHFFIVVSVVLTAMAFYLWFTTGDEKYGVDFRGGREIVVDFESPVSTEQVRGAMTESGFGRAIVQEFQGGGNQFSVRFDEQESGTAAGDAREQALIRIKDALAKAAGGKAVNIVQDDVVGPVIGAQIRKDALWAMGCSLIMMLVYIGYRFEWRYGVGSLFALFHDVIITIGICLLFDMEMTGGILAALLTIVGYSVHDTIIVFDRIRENVGRALKKDSKLPKPDSFSGLAKLMNISVNETLSRSILTSLTVFFVVLVLFLVGGGALKDMSFALLVGVIVGTYSSVFVACPVVLMFEKKD